MSATASAPVRDWLLGVIKREFMPFRFAAEMLARAARKTPRAARNWLSDNNAPDAEALINLMVSCHTIADEVNRFVEERRAALERQECPGSGLPYAASGSDTTKDHPRRAA
ncbi:hypothetical protein [Kozakia baliensis]|uniref:hypothetical protein n=1 Tax=Kozakia baliensis TaxID=153496 RepID=UPI000497181C|nr:hypothetical protein [Kozakia baliensis]